MKKKTIERQAEKPADARLYVKLSRAAKLLDCSYGKVYQAISTGKIRSIKVLGMHRIPIREIEKLANEV